MRDGSAVKMAEMFDVSCDEIVDTCEDRSGEDGLVFRNQMHIVRNEL